MTTEEKARAYDEALERAKALRQEAIDKEYAIDYVKDYEAIFPELAESEDERIRKWLIDYFSSIEETVWIHRDITCEQILAYLEKQKEQKPAEWSEEDEDMLNSCISSIEEAKENRYAYKETDGDTSYDHEISWLKSLRPQPKKNDMITPNKEFFQWIYNRLVDVHNENPNVDYMISFKKRIEEMSFDKSHWRPSEEQMKALEDAFRKNGSDEYRKTINSLYQDLKKLTITETR